MPRGKKSAQSAVMSQLDWLRFLPNAGGTVASSAMTSAAGYASEIAEQTKMLNEYQVEIEGCRKEISTRKAMLSSVCRRAERDARSLYGDDAVAKAKAKAEPEEDPVVTASA